MLPLEQVADLMQLILLDLLQTLEKFFFAGGAVLALIAFVTFVLWVLMLERLWFFHGAYKIHVNLLEKQWLARNERSSWNAEVTRQQWISESRVLIGQNLPLIKTLIALCPLFGLLGTVTGMIEVFSVLSITGGGEAKLMAAGVSRATIPTMAGMVTALSGVFVNVYVMRTARSKCQLIEERLIMER